jgi:hypothetical protein
VPRNCVARLIQYLAVLALLTACGRDSGPTRPADPLINKPAAQVEMVRTAVADARDRATFGLSAAGTATTLRGQLSLLHDALGTRRIVAVQQARDAVLSTLSATQAMAPQDDNPDRTVIRLALGQVDALLQP